MMRKKSATSRLWMTVSLILIFTIILTGFRLFWVSAYSNPKQLDIVNGELDLRGIDLAEEGAITLSGEWKFYPYELHEKVPPDQGDNDGRILNVPGDWSAALNEEEESPYGYGSYYLRLFVDPDQDIAFSMRIPSVRSASALYANGLYVGKSGEVGTTGNNSKAWNVPYTSTSIRADEDGVIDIVLQATNFEDPRASGLVRSVKFGTEETIKSEAELSTILQIVTATIFFIHALFACLIYIVGIRDKRLLYFAVVILALAFINVTGGDEKVLYQHINLGYTTVFKLSMFAMILLGWALIHCVSPQLKSFSKIILPGATVYLILSSIVIAFLPMDYLASSSNFTFGTVFVSAMLTIGALLWSRETIQGGILIALSLVAIISHYGWWAYTMATGVKFIYYPFDLIIAIICLAGVWFKHYHHMYLKTENFAKKLLKADKEKDEFLANTSHELRNPLHSILNISESVLERERPTLQNESIRNLETVLSVSRRMSSMLNDLLEMARLKDGNQILYFEPFSLQGVTAGVIDMFHYQAERKPVEIINEIPIDFPFVQGDENRVVQIIYNLVHNAFKFTTSGTITIKAVRQEERAVISVTDTGIGIAKENLQSIFSAYEQGDAGDTGTEGGFGLGLNICHRLVELHGGTLQVTSEQGEGATFSFSLPLADVNEDTLNIRHQLLDRSDKIVEDGLVHQAKVDANHKQDELLRDVPRLLIVDDDPINLDVMETILACEDYDVTTVLTGEVALSLVDKMQWDLVISDVMMPGISGYELTRQIRERYTSSELPILLLTARSTTEDIAKGFSAGANDYVTKPIDASELRARVNALTEVKKSFHERLRIEAAWMQAQIQPHFLFNTLNAMMALSEIDVERMRKLSDAFSNVLRGKFNFQNTNTFVPLADELSVIKSYLYIEKERFGERLTVVWDVDEDLTCMIPSLSIQPLVENAIEHGILKKSSGGTVSIRIKADENRVNISVEDDGVGVEEEVLQLIRSNRRASESGVGLLNTQLRLQRLIGEGLQINSQPGHGTVVSFSVPHSFSS